VTEDLLAGSDPFVTEDLLAGSDPSVTEDLLAGSDPSGADRPKPDVPLGAYLIRALGHDLQRHRRKAPKSDEEPALGPEERSSDERPDPGVREDDGVSF
jgi:hypothetical protein